MPKLSPDAILATVGREGLEPPVSNESGFTVRAATNYRLPPQIYLTTLNFRLDSNQRAPLDVIYPGCVGFAFRTTNVQSNQLLR